MADYIDRKAVMNALIELYAFYGKEVHLPHKRVCLMNDIDDPRMAIEKAEEMVLNLPAVDVVPVVRCKNCVHYREYPWGEGKVCMNYEYFLHTEPNDFCSDGERKVYEEDI